MQTVILGYGKILYQKSGKGLKKISILIDAMQYQELQGYLERLKTYAHHIEVCEEKRNSYSKTDHDEAFMRIKRDYTANCSRHTISRPLSVMNTLQ